MKQAYVQYIFSKRIGEAMESALVLLSRDLGDAWLMSLGQELRLRSPYRSAHERKRIVHRKARAGAIRQLEGKNVRMP